MTPLSACNWEKRLIHEPNWDTVSHPHRASEYLNGLRNSLPGGAAAECAAVALKPSSCSVGRAATSEVVDETVEMDDMDSSRLAVGTVGRRSPARSGGWWAGARDALPPFGFRGSAPCWRASSARVVRGRLR